MSRWAFRRLAAMSWPERTLRAQRWARDRRDRRTLPEGPDGPPAPDPGDFLRDGLDAPWILARARWNELAGRWPSAWRARTIEDAESVLAGRFTWFGVTRDLGPCPLWRTEPTSGVTFPATWSAALPTRNGQGTFDMKHLWELNAHASFVTLAKAHLLTGDARYRERLLVLWTDWMDHNPPYRGPNYVAPVEMARRLVHWGAALRLAGWRTPFSEPFLRRVFRHAYHHHRHIARNLSRYSSANNHLLGELAGLIVTAGAFSGLAAERERAQWRNELQNEMRRQFHADGGNREEALHYHAYSLSWALLAAQAASEAGAPWSDERLTRLRRAATFLEDALDVRDAPFHYGDSDESAVLPPAEDDSYRSVIAHARALLGGDLPPSGDERAAWLLGAAALPDASRPARVPRNAVYAESGHAFLRRGDLEVHVNGSDLGYLSIAAHAHADALSVEVRARGIPVIVDPGSFSYRGGSAWREWLVGTPAHATVTVDGRHQAERRGPFLWARHYRARLQSLSDFQVAAEHDGYRPLGIRHARRVLLEEGRVVVEDALEGTGSHRVLLTWPLGPGDAVLTEDGVRWTSEGLEARVRVTGLALPTRLDRGDPAQPGTPCVSPGYDRLLPAWAYRVEGEVMLPARWTTVIEIDRAG